MTVAIRRTVPTFGNSKAAARVTPGLAARAGLRPVSSNAGRAE
ncbi:hypothetical protein [Embleya sp. NPDC005575]